MSASYERLGAFYLGRLFDPKASRITSETLLYDAKDLTTHAVCVGMTGSGKTGLCVSLLEEAAIDGIPSILIDPKGDLGNLMLTFPSLDPKDFEPWIDPAQAQRKGKTPAEYARSTAKAWKDGLAEWGQDGSRIAKFRDAVDLTIYTPGSHSGVPLQVLRSMDAPPPALLEDPDALRERISASVSGLLALLDVDADPLQSREHILLSNLLDRAWRSGRGLRIGDLIREIQQPPFERIGVLDLESIFPSNERFGLAMRLNNLLASPGFSAWMDGDPMDIGRLLYTPEGRPRMSILSIAHLSDTERMFFVTLLLNEIVAWMRTQSGTSSLRAVLYMDEVFGFFPPVQNPPSKQPMLTLLKQARAFGLGVVLSTQNPVDLDYKGLSNAGTWFLGRLQTERDKERVLEGLEGASVAAGSRFDRAEMDRILAGLGSRVFLMNNVHEDAPTLFHTRWALSYLRGPLTRKQIQVLMEPKKQAAATGGAGMPAAAAGRYTPAPVPPPPRSAMARRAAEQANDVAAGRHVPPPGVTTLSGTAGASGTRPGLTERPILPAAVPEWFQAWRGAAPAAGEVVYRPALYARGKLHFARASLKVDTWIPFRILAPLPGTDVPNDPWNSAAKLDEKPDFDVEPVSGARYLPLPVEAERTGSYSDWETSLESWLYRTQSLETYRCKELKEHSRTGESRSEFVARLDLAARERRDLAVEKLRQKYAKKLESLQDKIERAQHKLEREHDQYKQQKFQTAVSLGATVLGALFGRKIASTRTVRSASTAARGAGRISREKGDIGRAAETLEDLQGKLDTLEAESAEEIERVQEEFDPSALEIEMIEIRPRKTDVQVEALGVAWVLGQ